MNDSPIYDRIGIGYTRHRQADPRLVEALIAQLGLEPGSAIADIGAGTGNYSRALADRGYNVTAVEPSEVMRAQAAPHPRVHWVAGRAEEIPLDDDAVDGAICTLAIHHFISARRGLLEMERISSGPVVIFTYDAREAESFWLAEYFPEIFAADRASFPPINDVAAMFENASKATVTPFHLPHDLCDYFFAAGWRRPEMYLDAEVRAGISVFAKADQVLVGLCVERLRDDLESGAWHERYGSIRGRESFDAGYRFVRGVKG